MISRLIILRVRRLHFTSVCMVSFIFIITYLLLKTHRIQTVKTIISDYGNVPSDAVVRHEIADMTKIAWSSYVQHCSTTSGNELRPLSKSCDSTSDEIVGAGHLLTAVDSLDTLHIMGLKNEFLEARSLIKNKFKLREGANVSVFEVTIRLLGGFLGAYSVTKDPLFKEKAKEVGISLMGAFYGQLAAPRVELFRDAPPASTTSLAEAGSLYLEFMMLSEITGDSKFAAVALRNQEALMKSPSLFGIYPNELKIKNGGRIVPQSGFRSVGARGDSFYEYLVKRCIFDRKVTQQCKSDYTQSLDGIMNYLSVNLGEYGTCLVPMGEKQCTTEHLACFAGGMYALAHLQTRSRTDWLDFAKSVTRACYLSYKHSSTGLGPEVFSFNRTEKKMEAQVDFYILRPEFVESLYYLYYVTGDQMYKAWGWSVIRALQKHANSGGGYSGVLNMRTKPNFDDVQWSFYLAETLKYLYLLFSDSNKFPLSHWTFNTEGHFLPTNKNPFREI